MNIPLVSLLLISLGAQFQGGLAYTTECKENEEYNECGTGCPLTCKNYSEPIFCTQHCKQGCFCKHGFVRGPDYKCILPEKCPIGPCGENEVASTCVNACNNCLQKGNCYYKDCKKGCDCKSGYYKNSTGFCVLASQCETEEPVCATNEHYVTCVNLCNDCWNRGYCDDDYCEPGCDCKPGFFRDDTGLCIPESECIAHDQSNGCGENEFFSDCANPCNDCERKGNCRYTCSYGCDCKHGFHRNRKGKCVPASECSAECGLYEEYTECGSACQPTCSTLGKSVLCSMNCVKGCVCVTGYVRNHDGKCVLPSDCPVECGENEEHNHCGSPCPLTCSNYSKPVLCDQYCVEGCFCKPGFVKNAQGKCVSPSLCPKVCGAYEEYQECGTACPVHCANLTVESNVPCPKICVKGCFCSKGYVRGPDGNCILPNKCPVVCGDHEIYHECGPPCEPSCSHSWTTPCNSSCKNGCFCKPGYVRGPKGSCILPSHCPKICDKKEVFKECGSACPPTCANRNRTCADVCVQGCFCKRRYIRDETGKCILPRNCPLNCKENEIFMKCGPRCESTCIEPHRSTALCPACKRGCFCKPGFVRGPRRKCILYTECPKICDENEEFKECGPACPANCADRAPNCLDECVKGCFCKDGYIKNQEGKCILPAYCPHICNENEEYLECGTPCPANCSNHYPRCAKVCAKGCFCKKGFIKDQYGKCIRPTECPMACGENEVFKPCGPTCITTCENYFRLKPCTHPCVTGCFCKPGYVKGPGGKCIFPEFCPRQGFGGRNLGGNATDIDDDEVTSTSKEKDETKITSADTSNTDSVAITTISANDPDSKALDEKMTTDAGEIKGTQSTSPPNSKALDEKMTTEAGKIEGTQSISQSTDKAKDEANKSTQETTVASDTSKSAPMSSTAMQNNDITVPLTTPPIANNTGFPSTELITDKVTPAPTAADPPKTTETPPKPLMTTATGDKAAHLPSAIKAADVPTTLSTGKATTPFASDVNETVTNTIGKDSTGDKTSANDDKTTPLINSDKTTSSTIVTTSEKPI